MNARLNQDPRLAIHRGPHVLPHGIQRNIGEIARRRAERCFDLGGLWSYGSVSIDDLTDADREQYRRRAALLRRAGRRYAAVAARHGNPVPR